MPLKRSIPPALSPGHAQKNGHPARSRLMARAGAAPPTLLSTASRRRPRGAVVLLDAGRPAPEPTRGVSAGTARKRPPNPAGRHSAGSRGTTRHWKAAGGIAWHGSRSVELRFSIGSRRQARNSSKVFNGFSLQGYSHVRKGKRRPKKKGPGGPFGGLVAVDLSGPRQSAYADHPCRCTASGHRS